MAKLGIDLGTSNSAAALLIGERARMVEPVEGKSEFANVFPSYLAFDRDGNLSAVGLRAKERRRDGATELVVCQFKRLIGKPYDYVAREIAKETRFFEEFKGRIERGPDGKVLIKVGERKLSGVEITSFLLRKIREDAESEAQRLWKESVSEVTISLPAGFDDSQRTDTLAAAQAAGFTNITIIEEPTAAAIARGITGDEGSIMVVDVGAGTTDIVVGHMAKAEDGLRLVMSTRKCDDELGGIDMDHLILEYLLKKDTMEPRLRDIYPNLDTVEKGRLMAKIESAKISTSLDCTSFVAINLRAGNRPKRIKVSLDEEILNEIVSPMVYGYKRNGRTKGIKPLLDDTLLEVAGNDRKKINKVKQEIEQLILVGGPCRMKSIQNMLMEVFKENDGIREQLQNIDPLDDFFMEGVATGCAISGRADVVTDTVVPFGVSIFHWRKGRTPIIPKGFPYAREKGVTKYAQVDVERGSQTLHILSEKEPLSKYDWPMKEHLVNVPEDGAIRMTLHWREAGTESSKAKMEGAGLPKAIEFPPVKDSTTLGTKLQDSFREYLDGAKNLRQRIEKARDPLRRMMFKDITRANPEIFQVLQEMPDLILDRFTIHGSSLRELIEEGIDKALHVPEKELKKCESINPEAYSDLTNEGIDIALKEGYFTARERWAQVCGIPKQAREILDLSFSLGESAPVELLIQIATQLLNIAQNCSTCSKFSKQLDQCLNRLRTKLADPSLGCMVAMSLGALADCLDNDGAVDSDIFTIAKNIAYAFSPEYP